jgi:DNA-binding CsgD family transcriptional regulator
MGDYDRPSPDTTAPTPSDGAVIDFLRSINEVTDAASLASLLAEGLLAPWSPSQLGVFVVDAERRSLSLETSYGLSADQIAGHSHVSLEVRLPVTQVFITGEEGWWDMRDATEAFPVVKGWAALGPAPMAAEGLATPIRATGRPLGVLLITFPDGVERSWALRSRIDAAVSALGLWLRAQDGHLASRSAARSRAARGVRLTARQHRLLELVGTGATNAQIAADLSVSVGTVKADLSRLFRVLGVSRREELPDVARAAGLLES